MRSSPRLVNRCSCMPALTHGRNNAARPGSDASPGHRSTVVVRKGDTLWSIAHSAGIKTAELQAANRIADNVIREGQVLHVPSACATRSAADASPAHPDSHGPAAGHGHTPRAPARPQPRAGLAPGDTPPGRRSPPRTRPRLPQHPPLAASHPHNPAHGPTLGPGAPTRPGPPPSAFVVRPSPHPPGSKASSASAETGAHTTWAVAAGDTWWEIARAKNVPLEALVAANAGLGQLHPGMTVRIPRSLQLRPLAASLSVAIPQAWDTPGGGPRFFGGMRVTRSPDALLELPWVQDLMKALRWVETSNRMPAPVGDGGASIGPLQIGRLYHLDAWAAPGATRGWPGGLPESEIDARYSACEGIPYAQCTVVRYWRRYLPWALQFGDAEHLSRAHNGGPSYHLAPKTARYWRKVTSALRPSTFEAPTRPRAGAVTGLPPPCGAWDRPRVMLPLVVTLDATGVEAARAELAWAARALRRLLAKPLGAPLAALRALGGALNPWASEEARAAGRPDDGMGSFEREERARRAAEARVASQHKARAAARRPPAQVVG